MNIKDYFIEASAGNAGNNTEVIHKFGHNAAVSTTIVPICHDSIYRTPQVGGATKVRIKAGNVNDSAAGTGARKVIVEGIDENGYYVKEELTTNGISAGANSINNFIRIYRAYISESGTYATVSSSSHAADVVIENAAGTEDWAVIQLNGSGYGDGQTEIGCYTVPRGKTAYMYAVKYSVDTTKVTTISLFKRENILDTSASYKAVNKQFGIVGAVTDGEFSLNAPIVFNELTDILFLTYVNTGTAVVSIGFDMILRDNE